MTTTPVTIAPLRGRNGMAALASWNQLEPVVPDIVATMRRYLEQISCVLRPGSVVNADIALRSFAGFLAETAADVTSTAQVTRRHIEDYKPWLAKRPGQNKTRVTTATLAHRLGTLRMFFVRIDEWGREEAPVRVPMFPAAADAGHRRGVVAHRPAGRRVHQPARGRSGSDRRCALATRPGRQAPRRPLPTSAPATGAADR